VNDVEFGLYDNFNVFVFKPLKKCYKIFLSVTLRPLKRLFVITKTNQLNLKSFIMKKSVVVLALALGVSIGNLNATNSTATSAYNDILSQSVEISPLCRAVATGNTEEVKRLINNGVDVNAASNGMMPIHYAAKYNRVDMIKVLITAGSKIHEPDNLGYTALRLAEKSNADDAALFLKRFKNKNV
jgi:ankyrin repeat protein